MDKYTNSLPEIEEGFESHMNETSDPQPTNSVRSMFNLQDKENIRKGALQPPSPRVTQTKTSQPTLFDKLKQPTQTQKRSTVKPFKSNSNNPSTEFDFLEKWCEYYPETEKPVFDVEYILLSTAHLTVT